MPEKSFEDLVEQAFSIGGEMFDELYRFVYCYLRFMGNHCDAEDAAQETLIMVWQKWKDDVRNRSSLKSWVLQIAHNKAVDNLRKRRTHLSLDGTGNPDGPPLYEAIAVINPEDIPEDNWEQTELKQVVWRALEEVSEVNRSCLILRLMQGIKAREVAQLHKCSIKQIERHVKQGKLEFNVAYKRLIDTQQTGGRRPDL